METVLTTGFEPFGGSSINPSLEAIQQHEGTTIPSGIIRTVNTPVVHQRSIDTVLRVIAEIKPVFIDDPAAYFTSLSVRAMVKAGFIHTPYMPQQSISGEQPSRPLATIVEGLKICATNAIAADTDIITIEGAIA